MSDFVTLLEEVFAQLGPVNARKMFGGYGLYHEGVMFGLVADDTLYLKADEMNVGTFTERALQPFEYDKGKKVVKMSYYQAPEEVLENPVEAAVWARRSFEAAKRAKT